MKIIAADALAACTGQRLPETGAFQFACHAGLSCFNLCCRNLNLFLYPYDILRLKNRLGLSSGEFIDRYVDVVMREGNYFPDVLLSMSESAGKTCPFLTSTGCGVYSDRTYSCRMFPLEQGLHFDGVSQEGRMIYFFRPPEFCLGRHQNRPLTVADWIHDQQVEEYIQMTRQWAGIKALFTVNPWDADGPYGPMGKMAFMAAYNIDAFREFVFNSSFLKRYRVPDHILEKIRAAETELMIFGFEWIKQYVRGISSPWLRPALPVKIA